MARPKRWNYGPLRNGVVEIKLSAWRWFSDHINQELLDFNRYIYRGHGNSSWKLEPTLDRIITSPNSPKRRVHLENFKFSSRGRRGAHPSRLESDDDWWALGQHHGLATPLLDWTESPFVALYFAAVSAQRESGSSFCVWALAQEHVKLYSGRIQDDDTVDKIDGRKPIVELVRPMTDENSRLVNQRGLFTRGPNNLPLEQWMHNNSSPDSNKLELMKLTIPKIGVTDCLRYLNRMNINHATLFPDLYGASNYCNLDLKLPKY